jgi:hypothetical protein
MSNCCRYVTGDVTDEYLAELHSARNDRAMERKKSDTVAIAVPVPAHGTAAAPAAVPAAYNLESSSSDNSSSSSVAVSNGTNGVHMNGSAAASNGVH